MALFNRFEAIACDSLSAVSLLALFFAASIQEIRSGHPATAWELVRAVR